MAKYRLKIERIEGSKYIHNGQIVIVADDSLDIKQRLKETFSDEYLKARELFMQWLSDRQPSFSAKIKAELLDKFDSNAVGNDIDDEEYIENEMFFALNE